MQEKRKMTEEDKKVVPPPMPDLEDEDYPETIFSEEMEELLSKSTELPVYNKDDNVGDSNDIVVKPEIQQPENKASASVPKRQNKGLSSSLPKLKLEDNTCADKLVSMRVRLSGKTYSLLKFVCFYTRQSQASIFEKLVSDYVVSKYAELKDRIEKDVLNSNDY